jgi:hypothetical protein
MLIGAKSKDPEELSTSILPQGILPGALSH